MANYYVRRVEVNNVKSFRDKFSIVFGHSVTAVTSTDAADKSNLVEAIGLALCESRASGKEEESVYANLLCDGNQPGYVTVTIGRIEEESYEKKFSTVFSGSSRTYEINGQAVGKIVYVQELDDVGLNATSNLLLYHRRQFEAIASKNSHKFGKFFEETCFGFAMVALYDKFAMTRKDLRRLYKNLQTLSNLFDFYHFKRILEDAKRSYSVSLANAKAILEDLWSDKDYHEFALWVGSLVERVRQRQNDADALQSRLDGVRKDLNDLPEKIGMLRESLAECSGRCDAQQSEVDALEAKLEEAEECQQSNKIPRMDLGSPTNVPLSADAARSCRASVDSKRAELLIILDERSEINNKLRDCCSELERLKSGEQHLEKMFQDALSTLQKGQAELAEQQSQLDDLNFKRTKIENEVEPERQKVFEMELLLNDVRVQRHSLLLNCKDNFIAMPITQGDLKQVTLIKKDLTQEDHFDFDFSDLTSELRDMTSNDRINEEKEKFQKKLKTLREYLEKPSKQNEGFENAQKEVAAYLRINKDLNKLFYNLKRDYDDFGEPEIQRREMFVLAFEGVAGIIDGIYKELTGDAMALASLILVDENEPYSKGIWFLCLAPNSTRLKRIHKLSPADQTMAALALSFAIQSFQKSPLLVIDDVDGALEVANITKVVNFLRGRGGQTVFLTSNEDVKAGFLDIFTALK